MLDTNVWSYLGDRGQGANFHRQMDSLGIQVVVPPSVLLELGRNPNAEVSRRHVGAVFAGPRQQLTSEADMQCSEVVRAVRKLHPDWIRQRPDTSRIHSLRSFWSRGIWRLANQEWEEFRHRIARTGAIERAAALSSAEVQRGNRRILLNHKIDLTPAQLWLQPSEDAPSWMAFAWPKNGSNIEAWRPEIESLYWRALGPSRLFRAGEGVEATLRDWLEPELDLEAMTSDHGFFARFWFAEVAAENIPRNWLVGACQVAQLNFKVQGSNAFDAQHCAYLLDCDLFLTSDRKFAETINAVARVAPFQVCPAKVLNDRENLLEQIAHAISDN